MRANTRKSEKQQNTSQSNKKERKRKKVGRGKVDVEEDREGRARNLQALLSLGLRCVLNAC